MSSIPQTHDNCCAKRGCRKFDSLLLRVDELRMKNAYLEETCTDLRRNLLNVQIELKNKTESDEIRAKLVIALDNELKRTTDKLTGVKKKWREYDNVRTTNNNNSKRRRVCRDELDKMCKEVPNDSNPKQEN